MLYEKELRLIDSLQEIYQFSRILAPLLEKGREDFEQFSLSINKVLEKVSPFYSVAFSGPVNSGKSSILSSLIYEEMDPISPVGPSNETFAPMIISFSKHPKLFVQYFGIEIIHQIIEHLSSLEKTSQSAHEVAKYREILNILRKIPAVKAGDARGVMRAIDLKGERREKISRIIRDNVALSSGKNEVYGIYRVELGFPAKLLKELNNIRFVDLFGFGEPSPLINMKFTRFLSEETFDAVVYVFPDRSITADFENLFKIPKFLENIVKEGRLFLILNKADSYPDKNPKQWNSVIEDFRKTITRHMPILKKYIPTIPIFVMSAASISTELGRKDYKEIRSNSIKSIRSLRSCFKELSLALDRKSSQLSIYFGTIFGLLDALEIIINVVENKLQLFEDKIPVLSSIIDKVSNRENEFIEMRSELLENFRKAVQDKLLKELADTDYEMANIDTSLAGLGEPKSLFRWMIDNSQKITVQIFLQFGTKIFEKLLNFIDQHIVEAYRGYVEWQDNAIKSELGELSHTSKELNPLSTTVTYVAKDILKILEDTAFNWTGKSLIERFSIWYLRERCEFNAERGQNISQIRQQINDNSIETFETFMKVFICEDPAVTPSFLSHICTSGEYTFWQQIKNRITKLDDLLAQQVHITKWKIGLFGDKEFFVVNRKAYDKAIHELRKVKNIAEDLILELTVE